MTIPASANRIGYAAFYGCSSLTSVTIPNSVITIDDFAFQYCSALTSVSIPNSVTSIGYCAFSGCTSLTSLRIPSSVTSISYCAFSGCTSLRAVSIPNSITRIEQYTFENCSSLTSVTIPDSVTYLGGFENCTSLTSLNIPISVTTIAYDPYPSDIILYYDGSEADKEKIIFETKGTQPSCEDYGTWVYAIQEPSTTPLAESTYPSWSTSYVDFVSVDIMPDISPINYSTASSRGLIAQSIYNIASNGATASNSGLLDVGSYQKAIDWCVENNVMLGQTGGIFGTENEISREAFALVLKALATAQGKDTSFSTDILKSYADSSSSSWWAEEGIAWAVTQGLMTGNSNGTLDPTGTLSRIQAAIMLKAFQELETI